jgi:hypothetical protein
MKRIAALGAVAVVAALSPLRAAPVPVRFAEGVTHGFLVLRDLDGAQLAQGDLLQIARGDEIDKRMIFQFNDGSVFDERVTFTERGHYVLKTYHLSQTGPSFPADTEISMTSATGAYRVKTRDHEDGEEKVLEGTLELPEDVYNGMILTVVKDLPAGKSETIHFVAFTPQPKIIELELVPDGAVSVAVGDLTKSAVHYVMKPRLGLWLKLIATIMGRVPPDLHAWILTDEVPAFVGFEGSFTTPGPVWRIELVSPGRPGSMQALSTAGARPALASRAP